MSPSRSGGCGLFRFGKNRISHVYVAIEDKGIAAEGEGDDVAEARHVSVVERTGRACRQRHRAVTFERVAVSINRKHFCVLGISAATRAVVTIDNIRHWRIFTI